MDKLSAQKIIESRTVCTALGSNYTLKVDNVSPFMHPERGLLHIVNLNGVTQWQLSEAVKAFKAGEYDKAANFKMSTSRRDNKDWVPAKGELVNVVLGEVTSAQGVVSIQVISIAPLPQAVAKKVSLASLLEEPVAEGVATGSVIIP